jgi:hypothetical protein
MIESFEPADLIALFVIVTGFLLVIGLIRPGFVVFWSPNKSRMNVIAVWGSLVLVLALSYFLVKGETHIDPFKDGTTDVRKE